MKIDRHAPSLGVTMALSMRERMRARALEQLLLRLRLRWLWLPWWLSENAGPDPTFAEISGGTRGSSAPWWRNRTGFFAKPLARKFNQALSAVHRGQVDRATKVIASACWLDLRCMHDVCLRASLKNGLRFGHGFQYRQGGFRIPNLQQEARFLKLRPLRQRRYAQEEGANDRASEPNHCVLLRYARHPGRRCTPA